MKKIAMIVIFSALVYAEYCAVGGYEGSVCSGFVIESCEFKSIDAVSSHGDKSLFTMRECHDDVDEFRKINGKQMCWINTKNSFLEYATLGIKKTLPTFYHKSNNKYEKVQPDFLVFECEKR